MPDQSKRLRIVFAGTPVFAAGHLQSLLENGCNVIAVYTQPDRPANRGRKLTPSAVKQLAQNHDLPVYQPQSLKNTEAQQQLSALQPDIMVVVAYGLLLPKPVLEIPQLGCINVHASLLPRWRGAAPIQRAIEAGDTRTGITIMQMDEGLDTGAMLIKRECSIAETDTAASLHDRLMAIGESALIDSINQLATNTASPVTQDYLLGTYAAKIRKDEALLDWQKSAETLALKIRAFNPAPVAFSSICDERVKIWQAAVEKTTNTEKPGVIVNSAENGIIVACGKDNLRITELQLPGKKRLPVAEVLKSRSGLFAPGQRFSMPDATGEEHL